MELANANFSKTINARILDKKLSGLQWISPSYIENPALELQLLKEVKKVIPKIIKDVKIIANEWILKLQEQAKHSASVNKFEQGIQSLSSEFLDELGQIALDPIEELRVEQEYNKLKTQIQTKQPKGR